MILVILMSPSMINTGFTYEHLPKLIAVWHDNTFGNYDIFMSKSTDGGNVFSMPKDINSSPGLSLVPAIATKGDNVYVVWHDSTSGNSDIFMSKSTDGGDTFGEPINISNNEGFSGFAQVAIDDNNVYVVWQDGTNTEGIREILLAKSTDGGDTFGEPINISNNSGISLLPQIAVRGSSIFVVWSDDIDGFDRIFMSKSTDGGDTFGEPINIFEMTSDNESNFSFQPSISFNGNNVYVVWHSDPQGTRDIFMSKSTDGGDTFGEPINISENFDFSSKSAIFVERDNVFVAWMSDIPNNNDAYVSKSTDGGDTFGEPINISNNHGFSNDASTVLTAAFEPSIISHDDNVFVAWTDGTPGNWEILLAKSTDGGDTFGEPINISNNDGDSKEPDLALILSMKDDPDMPSFEGILGSGNNINIQVQENSGNNVGGQSGNGQMYSDQSIFQGQSTDQDSSVVS